MPDLNSKYQLRRMQPADSTAIAALITEFDGDMTTHFLVDAFTAITQGTEFPTTGVVAECEGHTGLVGMGTVRFSTVQYNEELLPLAFLDGLKVHKDHRGRGLGYQLANWRVQHARETFGDRCVIATGMLQENIASYSVAKKWCREFLEPAAEVRVLPVRGQPPARPDGIKACEIGPDQFGEFSARQNFFYQGHHFYPPASSESMRSAVDIAVSGIKPYSFFGAVDTRGNLLAGAQACARGLLKSDTINHPPAPLRLLNSFLHLFPTSFTIQEIGISGLWYADGQARAARFLWEMIRWECRVLGTTLTASFDPRDPTREVVMLRPWNQPRPKITCAVFGPDAIQRDKLVFAWGRV